MFFILELKDLVWLLYSMEVLIGFGHLLGNWLDFHLVEILLRWLIILRKIRKLIWMRKEVRRQNQKLKRLTFLIFWSQLIRSRGVKIMQIKREQLSCGRMSDRGLWNWWKKKKKQEDRISYNNNHHRFLQKNHHNFYLQKVRRSLFQWKLFKKRELMFLKP